MIIPVAREMFLLISWCACAVLLCAATLPLFVLSIDLI